MIVQNQVWSACLEAGLIILSCVSRSRLILTQCLFLLTSISHVALPGGTGGPVEPPALVQGEAGGEPSPRQVSLHHGLWLWLWEPAGQTAGQERHEGAGCMSEGRGS